MCIASPSYERRQPEQTQLYRIIADHWQTFLQERSFEGRDVPKFVRQEFEGFLRCGILACGLVAFVVQAAALTSLWPFLARGGAFVRRVALGECLKRQPASWMR